MRIPKNCSARVLLRAFVLLAALFSAWIPARAAPPLRVSEADARLDAPPPQFQWLGQAGGSMLAVALQGSLAYVGVGPRLCILDVSQPSQPVMLGQTDPLPDTVENLLVSGEYAYVADTTAGCVSVSLTTDSPSTRTISTTARITSASTLRSRHRSMP